MNSPLEPEKVFTNMSNLIFEQQPPILTPFHRKFIYNLIDSTDDSKLLRAWLSILTAEKVLPIWEIGSSNDPLGMELIELARKYLNNAVELQKATMYGEEAWFRFDNQANTPNAFNAFFAGEAIIHALSEVLGNDFFAELQINYKDGSNTIVRIGSQIIYSDKDLDPWHKDSASLAAIAYSSGSNFRDFDHGKCQEFWRWWMKEAIPQAWKLAQGFAF